MPVRLTVGTATWQRSLGRLLRLVTVIDAFSTGTGMAAAALVIPLGLIMTYEALARFALNLPTFWAYELSYMLTGAHFALGIGLVTQQGGHIRIDFIYARLSRRMRDLLDFTVLLTAMTPVTIWIAWGWSEYAWTAWQLGERSGESGWNPLIWPVRVAIACGMAIFALQLVSETVKTGARLFGFHPNPER